MGEVNFSIVIPAYKRANYLNRLLQSISIQTYKNFEVVITDDSDDDSVFLIAEQYKQHFPLRYKKNEPSLGTPENWNAGIRLSIGKWIKIMHDDDWFATPESLEKFAELIKVNPKSRFVFSGSSFIRNERKFGELKIKKWECNLLKKDPTNLYFKNFIGPPSVVAHRNTKRIWYDNKMKWLVDVDFYIRYLQHSNDFAYTNEALINVGYSESQVTEQVFHDKNVVVKEDLLFFQKQPHSILKKIWNYDYAWRMMRNYKIQSMQELHAVCALPDLSIPVYYSHIISFQRVIPYWILKTGIFSKIFMAVSYMVSRLR